jgi:hypothetical protein
MQRRVTWIRRRVLALAVAALGVVAISGTALAGHQTSGVKSYTGCLVSGDGVLIKIKEGNVPRSACTGGQVEAHFSGGDITKISVGGGLSLPNGGDNGEVRIVLDASHSLPQGCSTNEFARWSGSAWSCGSHTSGIGIDLNLSSNGLVTHDISQSYRVKNTPDCPSGQFATGFDADGTIQCSAPTGTGTRGTFGMAETEIELAGTMTVVSRTLPAGFWLLFAHVDTFNKRFDGSDESSARCAIPGDSAGIVIPDDPDDRGTSNDNLSLVGAVVHSGGPVALTCTELSGNIDIARATLAGIQIDRSSG